MISNRIQFEINKYPDLEPSEIMLGTWLFNEFIKEREQIELQKFDKSKPLQYLGLPVVVSEIINPNEIRIWRNDSLGINKFFHSSHDLGVALKRSSEAFFKLSIISICAQRYTEKKDFDENYMLMIDLPKRYYKHFIKMLKAGFTIEPAIKLLKETYHF